MLRVSVYVLFAALCACSNSKYGNLYMSDSEESDSPSETVVAQPVGSHSARADTLASLAPRSSVGVRIATLLAKTSIPARSNSNSRSLRSSMRYNARQESHVFTIQKTCSILETLANDLRQELPSLDVHERRAIASTVRTHPMPLDNHEEQARLALRWRVLGMIVAPSIHEESNNVHHSDSFDWYAWPKRVSGAVMLELLSNKMLTFDDFALLLHDPAVFYQLTISEFLPFVEPLVKIDPLFILRIIQDNAVDRAFCNELSLKVAVTTAGPSSRDIGCTPAMQDRLFSASVSVLAHANAVFGRHKSKATPWLPTVWRAVIDGTNIEDRVTSSTAIEGVLPVSSILERRLAVLIRFASDTLAAAAADGTLRIPYDPFMIAPVSRSASHHSLQQYVDLLVPALSCNAAPADSLQARLSRGRTGFSCTKQHVGAAKNRILKAMMHENHCISSDMILSAADTILATLRSLQRTEVDTLPLAIYVSQEFFDVVYAAAHNVSRQKNMASAVHLVARSVWRNVARMVFERLASFATTNGSGRATKRVSSGGSFDSAFGLWQDNVRPLFIFEGSSFDESLRYIAQTPYLGPQDGGASSEEDTDAGLSQVANKSTRGRKRRADKKVHVKTVSQAKHGYFAGTVGLLPPRPVVFKTQLRADRSEDEEVAAERQSTTELSSLMAKMNVAADPDTFFHMLVQRVTKETLDAFPLPPLFVSKYETLIEVLSTCMDRVFRIMTPKQSVFFLAMRYSLRLRSESERCRVLNNHRSHPVAVTAWSAATPSPSFPRARGRSSLCPLQVQSVVVLPAWFSDLCSPTHVIRALEMHALLHYGIDPATFGAAFQSVFAKKSSHAIIQCADLQTVAAVFSSLLGNDLFVAILAHRS